MKATFVFVLKVIAPLLAFGLALAFCPFHANGADPGWMFTPPKVVGSKRFVKQVNMALELIRQDSPESYRLIQRHVGIIKQGKRSGMWAFKHPPVFEMADPTTFHSVTWCAGSIAHDAFHSLLYQDYLITNSVPVPAKIWSGQDAELKCIAFQVEVLKKIRAPRSEWEYCANLDGMHFDTNGDGKSTWDDYYKRDW